MSFQGHPCTIRYIGEVKDTEKEWLGVEWDDPSRGKNDGKGYFECKLSDIGDDFTSIF